MLLVSNMWAMPRLSRDVVFVDGVRTPFGKAGSLYRETRADDLVVSCIRALLRRHPELPPERVDEVAIAATTQIGDQGLTIGRTAALLAGLPRSVPGYAIDRMCAGAMTAVTTTASGIAFGAYDVAIAGGVEHMGHHPMGEGIDPNPRIVAEKIVDPSALVMGSTAENLHDRFPAITRERADEFALQSQQRVATAYAGGVIQESLVPIATRSAELGWGLATADEPPRPGTTLDGLSELRTPFRSHGRVSAGNAAGLNDGATACLLAAEDVAHELDLPVAMRLVSYGFAGVDPEVMGVGPVPGDRAGAAQRRSDHRRHRRLRDQRGVRRPGARLPRPLRSRSRQRPDQPVRRRDRPRPPAGQLRGPADDPPGPPVPGAPRDPVRPHHHVHRAGHGRHRHLGEPAPHRCPADRGSRASERRRPHPPAA